MGHHLTKDGKFQSDKYPDLAPDKIIINFNDKRAHKALVLFAADCQSTDPELAADILARIRVLKNLP